MFQSLSSRLGSIFDRLRNRGALTEDDVNQVLREIRLALLEADVALPAAKQFIEDVRQEAIGQNVIKSVTPGQMVVKIVNDHLVKFLAESAGELNLQTQPPAVILMVGLQGSGKTTSTAKLALYLTKRLNKKVLMASLDVYRPAAQKQLDVLGQQLNIQTLEIIQQQQPLDIAKRALQTARQQGVDVLLLDTAGRLHIDDDLMQELENVKAATQPIETLLVIDSMMGQDALTTARTFHERVNVTGVVLTRVDGDARGGAALSVKTVTGQPLKFMGVGEKPEQFEAFDAHRVASRILGMGDVVGLVEKAMEAVKEEDTAKMVEKMQKGAFDLTDMEQQLSQMMKMGGLGSIMGMIPGMGNMMDKAKAAGFDDSTVKRQVAIIRSMTPKERRKPELLNASRRRRIASGAGVDVQAVNRLIKQFEQMRDVMKRLKKMGGKAGLIGGIKNLFTR